MEVTWWSSTTATELQLLALALVCSAAIGIERQMRRKSAGLRTHVLVAVGSAAFTLVSAFGFDGIDATQVTYDPSRIAAQIVSGVGFLGAGVIFMRKSVVRGLTTAAGIWVSAAVGMCCGAGMPTLAIATTLAHLVVLTALAPLARRFPDLDARRGLKVEYRDGEGVLRAILEELRELGTSAVLESSVARPDKTPATVVVRLRLGRGPAISDVAMALTEVAGVVGVWAAHESSDGAVELA